MIKEKFIEIVGHSRNYQFFTNLGYIIEIGKITSVDPNHLMKGSSVQITSICDLCGSESKNAFKDYHNYTNGLSDQFFCKKCNKIKAEKTCLEKWGSKNPMQNQKIKDKLKKSIQEKYGVDHYSSTNEYKSKFKKTCREKYGVDNVFSDPIIKEKIKLSNLKKYGGHPMSNASVKDKRKSTCLKNWGHTSYSKTENFKTKVSETSIVNLGVKNPMQNDEIKSKAKETNIKRYGFDSFSKTEEYKIQSKDKKQLKTKLRFEEKLNMEYSISEYNNDLFKINHLRNNHEFEILRDNLSSRLKIGIEICTICNPIGHKYSFIEQEIRNFLDNNKIEYSSNDRSTLNGQELDILIPNHKLALEINGIYWHSEFYKEKNYHRNKSIGCKNKNIDLIHIWEDDWKFKREILKSIISNKLKLNSHKIYARKCQVKEVDSKTSRVFLNENHIQGYSSSSLKLGLYNNDKLVSLMTFGFRHTNGKKEYELIRFCNKINTSVIGSASKLFNHLLKNFSIEKIVSYADISVFNGNLYQSLGFKKISLSSPNYFWVVNGIKTHRFNHTKKKLIKLGFDPQKTEIEIMHSRGHYRVFSTGQEKWEWSR